MNRNFMRAGGAAPIAGIAIAVLGSMVALSLQARSTETANRRHRQAFEHSAAQTRDRIAAQVQRSVDLVSAAAAYVQASPGVDQPAFASWGRGAMTAGPYPGIRSVSMIVPVADSALDAFTTARLAEAGPAFRVAPLRGVAEHVIPTYTTGDPSSLGVDLAGSPARDEALAQARDSGTVVVTSSFFLAIDAGLPPEQRHPAFAAYAPVYQGSPAPVTPEQRQQALVGWTAAAFRVADLSDDLARLSPETAFAWFDGSTPDARSLLASSRDGLARLVNAGADVTVLPLDVEGRAWTLEFVDLRPGPKGGVSMTTVLAFVVSLAFAVAFGRLLRERNLLSSTGDQESRYFEAVIASMDNLVITCDASGRLTHSNDAARRHLGLGVVDVDPNEWSAHYNVFRPGEETPAAKQELPLWRAAHGETVRNEDFVVRPTGKPVRVLSASARPVVSHEGELLGAVVTAHDVTDRARAEELAVGQARTDALTGLPNRLAAFQELTGRLTAPDRRSRVSVLFVDLDGFKPVNDRHGHHAGDEVLRTVAERIRAQARSGSFVARLGGDEFLVILDGESTAAQRLGERILLAVSEPIAVLGGIVSVSASIGVAEGGPGDDADAVVRRADLFMYAAKTLGGDGLTHANELESPAIDGPSSTC